MKLLANKLQGMEYYWPADKVHKQEPQHKYIELFHTTIMADAMTHYFTATYVRMHG